MIVVVREKGAGIDVHRDMGMVCWMWGGGPPGSAVGNQEVRHDGGELLQLKGWLQERGCQEVVVESTGVYWEPVCNVLCQEWEALKRLQRVGRERALTEEEQQQQQALAQTAIGVTLANPQEVKKRRGHKTDKKDACWLAHLFRHGMIRASYVPERPVRELRMLTRQRREKIRNVALEKNRLQKVLEQGNVKLRGVMSDLFGVSGEAMLRAMIQGNETDPGKRADLAQGSFQNKREQIIAALEGHRLPETYRLLLRQGMEHLAPAGAAD